VVSRFFTHKHFRVLEQIKTKFDMFRELRILLDTNKYRRFKLVQFQKDFDAFFGMAKSQLGLSEVQYRRICILEKAMELLIKQKQYLLRQRPDMLVDSEQARIE
jgi:hypothetical protein